MENQPVRGYNDNHSSIVTGKQYKARRGITDSSEERLRFGEILSGNRVVATIDNWKFSITDSERCPLMLRRFKVYDWMMKRAIDGHRTNSRLLKRALRLKQYDDIAAVLRVHAATLTDDYWFREAGENISYKDVRFNENLFSTLALRGDPDAFVRGTEKSVTPELTNTGSFEKCWEYIDDDWWMIKSGKPPELFSEQFIYELGRRIGLNMAKYHRRNGYIYSKNFCGDSLNFEPMLAVYDDESNYPENYRRLHDLCPEAGKSYLGMIYLDSIVLNMDRHTENYGIVRERDTGKITGLAPLFDHNIALVSMGYPKLSNAGNPLQKDFVDLLASEESAAEDFVSLGLTAPSEEMVLEAIKDSLVPSEDDGLIDAEFVRDFVMNGQMWIEDRFKDIPALRNAFVGNKNLSNSKGAGGFAEYRRNSADHPSQGGKACENENIGR